MMIKLCSVFFSSRDADPAMKAVFVRNAFLHGEADKMLAGVMYHQCVGCAQ